MIVAPIHAKPQTSDVNTSLTSAERSAAVGVDLASGDVEDSDLTVGMFMDRAPHTVQSEATVREALSVLAETSTSGIVVVDKNRDAGWLCFRWRQDLLPRRFVGTIYRCNNVCISHF